MIPLFRLLVGGNTVIYAKDAVESGWWTSGGEYNKRLEKWFNSYLADGFRSLSLNSGTSACRAALFACLSGVSGKVLTTTYSCAANVAPIFEAGCEAVFADVDLSTFGVDVASLETTIERNGDIKAAFIPYIYGEPPRDVESIYAVLQRNRIPLICDVSEALGMDPKLFFGDVIVASMRTEKMVGCGEGGVMATRYSRYAEAAEQFADRGKPAPAVKYWYASFGDNVRMPNVTAAIAVGQTEVLNMIVAGKRRTAKMYRDRAYFSKIGTWQRASDGGVNWLNCLLLNDVGISASDLMLALSSKGVECRPGFYPLPVYWARLSGRDKADFNYSNASFINRRGVVFPSPYDLTDEELDYVEYQTRRIIG